MARVIPQWVRDRLTKGTDSGIGLKHGFRSGLEEANAELIAAAGYPVVFETFKVPYMIPETRHTYMPDFKLPNHIIVECKGIFDSTDRAKHLFVKAQYPELDIRFVFTSSRAKINPGSKTTLADWCRKQGYLFADKRIPATWLTEPGPGEDPEEVIRRGPWGYLQKPSKD